MKLTLTRYVDSAPAAVEHNLDHAVAIGLDAAAGVVGDRAETHIEHIDHGLRVERGLAPLDGSEVRVSGTDRLTTLEIAVPWSSADAGSPKLWAAVRFAETVTDEVSLAA